ncbi:uncharacterized protein LOC113341913 [Papaver somniferum]|uniref:uncharacterized protein LOC113341913 n=1 Tax=Papaver somniferum TaxID=3469 RepID=UPI000E6F9EEE|nr:uncharacterized protein LOC113341913 [Papaver somniferum]
MASSSTYVPGPISNGKPIVYVHCKYCNTTITGGISRFKSHLAHTRKGVHACPDVPADTKLEMQDLLRKGENSRAVKIRNFDYMVSEGSYSHAQTESESELELGVESTPNASNSDRGRRGPMDRSSSFANILRSVGEYGRGLKQPSMYELSTWVLREEVKTKNKMVDSSKRTWTATGVTIMSDGWTDSIDASKYVKDANRLFKVLDTIVEEVGEEHLMQVVTDNAPAYKSAGNLLMRKRKKLYWTLCAAHCIDLRLAKLFELPQMKKAYLIAKKQTDGKDVKKIILRDQTFWPGLVYSLKAMKPLVGVLRLIDAENVPAMGFIYGAMDRAK